MTEMTEDEEFMAELRESIQKFPPMNAKATCVSAVIDARDETATSYILSFMGLIGDDRQVVAHVELGEERLKGLVMSIRDLLNPSDAPKP